MQIRSVTLVTIITMNRGISNKFQNFFNNCDWQYSPRGPENPENVLRGVDVDQQDHTMERLLQHKKVKSVPSDDPPFSTVFSKLVTPQLLKLLITFHWKCERGQHNPS